MNLTGLQITPFTISSGGSVGTKYRIFPYYCLDRPASPIYDPVSSVHNPVRNLWVGSMDQEIVRYVFKLPVIGDDR